MKVEQIAIYLKNESGKLAAITAILAENGINISALSMVDNSDLGILRLIVNDTGAAVQLLKNNGYDVKIDLVVVVEVPDRPGGLAKVLQDVKKADLNIDYLYAFSQKSGEFGLIIIRFDDLDAAIDILNRSGVRVLSTEEVYAI